MKPLVISWKKSHRVVALVIVLPLIVIAITGVILQLRNQFEYLQPTVVKSERVDGSQLLSLESITEEFGKENIEQIIYRPLKDSMVVRLKDDMEVQIHPQTGEILKKAKRRTNFLIELHQGSWLGVFGQYAVHFVTGLGLCFLILSGIIIYPFKRKRV